METVEYSEAVFDKAPFAGLIGEGFFDFIIEHAPRKVMNRVVSASHHYTCASKLVGIDEEIGAVRLIAGEDELIVAIFEWLKLNEDKYPDQKDFVKKFKNHVVKLSFYPVLSQFNFAIGDMLQKGFSLNASKRS